MDSIIANSPNSNAAKLLAENYEKILNRISMANPKSCTHIKVSGVRCNSPALRGEHFCYFHQQAHRGVRRPPFARLHPISILEDADSIQASLMEVINGLLRNTLDVKRAELIIRALHIAAKNVRNLKLDTDLDPKVKEVPDYPLPVIKNLEYKTNEPASIDPEAELPAIAAKPPQPIDPQDPHSHERSEEGGRVLGREAARRAAETRLAVHGGPGNLYVGTANVHADTRNPHAETAAIGGQASQASASVPSEAKASVPAPPQRSPQPSRLSKAGNPAVNPGKRKPPVNAKPNGKYSPSPQERKTTPQRASAG